MLQATRNARVGPTPTSHGFCFENKFGDTVRTVKGHNLARAVRELVDTTPAEILAKLKLLSSSQNVHEIVATGVLPGLVVV